jgi:hypothetical protein
VADIRQILTSHKAAYATMTDSESIYTLSEIKKAKDAYEFLKCSGNTSPPTWKYIWFTRPHKRRLE